MTLIIAHRGASALARENTIEAFQKAIDIGADMVEFDVRRTKDKVLIVYHDEYLRSDNVKLINELTHQEIMDITKKEGYKVPLLEEVLKLCSGRIGVDVELKEAGYEEEVLNLILKYFDTKKFLITSFNNISLSAVKATNPNISVGLILGSSKLKENFRHLLSLLIYYFKKSEIDFVVPNWGLLRFGLLGLGKKRGKTIFVWGVNDEQMIRDSLSKKVDAIITDRPDIALSLLE